MFVLNNNLAEFVTLSLACTVCRQQRAGPCGPIYCTYNSIYSPRGGTRFLGMAAINFILKLLGTVSKKDSFILPRGESTYIIYNSTQYELTKANHSLTTMKMMDWFIITVCDRGRVRYS